MRGLGSQLLTTVNINRQIEAEAGLAVQELEEKVRLRGGVLTPTLVKNAITERIVRFLGPGVRAPVVTVGVRRSDGGFDIDIRPADAMPAGMIVK